ncbi:putative metalloprotease EGY1 [Helianthus annuus]|nr:putative metalloprotease EGY1 [Helianthus annuus]
MIEMSDSLFIHRPFNVDQVITRGLLKEKFPVHGLQLKKKCMKQLKLQNPQIQVVQPLMMIKEKIRGSLVSWNYSTNSWMVTRLKSPARIKSNQVNLRLNLKKSPSEETETDNIEITSGSPLPGVKPQELDDVIMIPKETIDILKDQVFGFNTFFITSQEPYEAGVLFKGNLRGSASVSYKKIEKRLQTGTRHLVYEWIAGGHCYRLMILLPLIC